MATNLNDIYDPKGVEQEGPKPKPTPPKGGITPESYLALRSGTPNAQPRAGTTFSFNADPSDVQKWFGDTGVADPAITGLDNILEMGRRQSVGNKVVRRIGNLVPNIVSNLVDIAGRTGALLSEGFGDNRDYDNAIIRAANEIRDPFGSNYNRTDQSTLGSTLADPTWWVDNSAMLIEFAVPYAAVGAGVGTLMSRAAAGASRILNAGVTTTRGINMLSRGLTASWLAYSESAQAGEQVFKEVYDNQLKKSLAEGMTLDEAKTNAQHIAAQSAASTVQLGTALTAALNLHAISPYFKKADDAAAAAIRSQAERLPGESMDQWASRIKGLSADEVMPGRGAFYHKLIEAGMEGSEEVVQQFAQQTGSDLGKDGKVAGFLEQFGQLERFFDRVANKDGVLAFALGAAGGGLMEFVQTNLIPSRRIESVDSNGVPIQKTDEDGELVYDEKGVPIYKEKFVTPKTFDEWQTKRAFNNIRDAFAFDIENYSKLQNQLLKAVKAGDTVSADLAREQMLNPTQVNAVINGITEPWIATYQAIADTDNERSLAEDRQPEIDAALQRIQSATTEEEKSLAETEYNELIQRYQELDTTDAVRQGLAKDRNDNEYKDRAQEAISTLKEYQKEYDALRSKFGIQYEANIGLKQYVNMLFARKVDLMSMDKTIQKHEKILQDREASELEGLKITNKAVFTDLIAELNKQYKSLREVQGRMQLDLDVLKKAVDNGDITTIRRLLGKYRAVGINDADIPGAVKDLIRKINTHNEQLIARTQQAEENLYNSPAYTIWREKNPGGTFSDFMNDVERNYSLSEENSNYRANIQEARQQFNIANQNYLDIANEKSISKFTKKSNDWISQMQQERQRIQEAETAELARRAKDKASLNKLQRVQLNKAAERYARLRDIELEKFSKLGEELNKLLDVSDKTSMLRDPLKKWGLQKQIKDTRALLSQSNRLIKQYSDMVEFYNIDTSTPEVEYPVEDLTSENDDVELIPKPVEETGEVALEENVDPLLGADITTMSDAEFDAYLDNVGNMAPSGAPPIEVENDSASYEVTKEFAKKLYPLSDVMKERMSELEEDLRKGRSGFSYDLLKPQVAQGLISQGDAVNLLELLRQYLIAEDILERTPEEIAYQAVQEVSQAKQFVDTNGVGIADTPIIRNTEQDTTTQVSAAVDDNGKATHEGSKILNVNTSANSTMHYTEYYDEKKKEYYKIDTFKLNENLNTDILIPGKLEAGTNIRLEVDTLYDGDSNINDDMILDDTGARVLGHETFSDYVDESGKISTVNSSIGNVPIKIVEVSTGKTIGYVRKLDWITAKYPNTSDYRNVVDSVSDKDGNIVDIMPTHIKSIMDIRKRVVDQYNRDKKPVDTKITSKGTGIVITNRDTNLNTGKNKPKPGFARSKNPDNSLLPDESLKLAIAGAEGQLFVGEGALFEGAVSGSRNLNMGNIVAILPTATEGQYSYGALIGQPLVDNKRKSALNTMVRAIELYLLNDGTNPAILEEIKKLQNNTSFETFSGFDLSTPKGLKNFLNQYITYSQSFNDADTSPNTTTSGPKVEQFLFNIWEPVGNQIKGSIRLGWSYSGREILKATLISGKLDPRFVSALEEGLSTRARAVVYTKPEMSIRGINSRGTFKDAAYTENGKWVHTEYPSYNEYVKSFSKTYVYGKNQVAGRYVYTANPQISYEIPRTPKIVGKSNDTTKKVIVKKTQDKFDSGAADLFDNLVSFSVTPTSQLATTAQIGSAPDNSRPLDMATLQEMYNFTPEVQRNGKTVVEVYESLIKSGHTFIASGYNPFSRCL